MGFLSSLFESSSESSAQSSSQSSATQEQESTQTGTQKGTTTGTKTGTQAGTISGQQTGVVSSLGGPEAELLSNLIQRLGLAQEASAGPAGLAAVSAQSAETDPAILGALSERALTFGEQRERIQADLRAAATQRFQETTARSVSGAQQKIGASGEFNTASQLLDLEAERKLGIDLAGLSASTDLQLNQQEEAALLAALSGSGIAGATAGAGSSAQLNELLQALTLSRGSQVVTKGTTEQQSAQKTTEQSSVEELIETLQTLVSSGSSTQQSSSKGTQQGTSQAPILGQIISAFSGIATGIGGLKAPPIT